MPCRVVKGEVAEPAPVVKNDKAVPPIMLAAVGFAKPEYVPVVGTTVSSNMVTLPIAESIC